MIPIDKDKIKHLDPKVKILWAFKTIILVICVWLFISGISPHVFPDGLFGVPITLFPFMFLMLAGVILVPYLIWVELKYRNYTYYISETEITIRRGILHIDRIAIPFEKVQNVNVSRPILERILGLANIKVETAGTNPNEAEGIIPGINNYQELINQILEKVEHNHTDALKRPATKQLSTEEKLIEEISALNAELHTLREHISKLEEQLESERYKKMDEKKSILKTKKQKKA